jgi:hypothetical protein
MYKRTIFIRSVRARAIPRFAKNPYFIGTFCKRDDARAFDFHVRA